MSFAHYGLDEMPERIDNNELTAVEIEGVDYYDHPDYEDAVVVYAELQGRALTEIELQEVNEKDLFELIMEK